MAKFYDGLMHLCGLLAALLVALVTLLVCYDVLARNTIGQGLGWIVEISEYALPTLIALSAPWLMFRNEHIRLDLLTMVLSPAKMAKVERLTAAVGVVASALFTWYSLALLLDSRASGALVMKALVFPEWWIYIPTPLGFALLTIECGRRLLMPAAAAEPEVHAGTKESLS